MMKKLLTAFAVLTMMTAFAMAQTTVPLTNSGTITNKGTIKVGTVTGKSIVNAGTGQILNNTGGLIQFTQDTPLFDNSAAGTVTNDGTIRFDGTFAIDVMSGLGTAAGVGARLGGTVLYNGTSAQTIQGGFYYTNLTLNSAGDKIYTGTDYYVSEVYTSDLAGDRTYGSSIFHYDGTTPTVQEIFAESGAMTGTENYYNNLQLEGTAAKTIDDGATVNVLAVFGEIAGVTLTMGDDSKLGLYLAINADVAGTITATGATIQMVGPNTGTFDVASGGAITFDAGVAPLFDMNGGTVTNAGTMTFNAGTYQQNSGNSIHSGTLALLGGDYNQVSGNVDLFGTTTINSATSAYTQTVGLITIGTATAGTMTVTEGTFLINGTTLGTDLVRIDAGGTLALSAGTNINKISMVAGTWMEVDGSFTSGATTNLAFNPTSTVTYDAGVEILVTSVDNSFGNLTLQTIEKKPLADIYVGGNFSLADVDLNMNTSTAGNSTLFIKTPSATNVVYGTGLMSDMEQVIGKMNRVITDASKDVVLVFNNNATTIKMTTIGLSGLTLNVTPNVTPDWTDYDATVDVKRTIAFDYTEAAANWAVEMAYGYEFNEFAAGLDQSLFRYREILSDLTTEKVATGKTITRVAATNAPTWGKVTLSGINDDLLTSLAIVADGNRLFLRGGPTTFYTISDGRWSNPGTWDEGMQPGSLDKTEILHTVHVGFAGGADFADGDGHIDERTNLAGSPNILAATILIRDLEGASLIFGNPVGGSYNSIAQTWELNTAGILTNLNSRAQATTDISAADLATFVTSGLAKYQGLIIFGGVAATNLSVSTTQLINTLGEVNIGPNTELIIQ